MKIPNKIRIAGVEYDVLYEPTLRDGGSVLFGRIDYERMQILLSEESNRNHQRYCLTLLHEVLHGIVEANGMEVEREEAVIEMFARGLYQVLQDNGGRLFDLEKEELEVVNASNEIEVNITEKIRILRSLADALNALSYEMQAKEQVGMRDACRDASYIVDELCKQSIIVLEELDLPSFRNLSSIDVGVKHGDGT